MKTTAITIIIAGSLLGATAALAQGTNAGAIPTNRGAIGTNPGAIGTNPGAFHTNPGAIGNGSVQSLQPLTGGQGLGYSISPLPDSSTLAPGSVGSISPSAPNVTGTPSSPSGGG